MLKISTTGESVPTVNYSVPEDVKRDFDETFAGENKSAVIARLMREAVEARRRAERRARAVDALLGVRGRARQVTPSEVRSARKRGRP